MPLRYRYDKTKVIKRPLIGDPGIPASPNDKLDKFSMEWGSQRLISALRAHHPHIVDYLVQKNGDGSGQFSLPE